MRSQIFRQIAQKFRRHTWCMARDFWAIWRKICKQIACKAVRRTLFSVSISSFGNALSSIAQSMFVDFVRCCFYCNFLFHGKQKAACYSSLSSQSLMKIRFKIRCWTAIIISRFFWSVKKIFYVFSTRNTTNCGDTAYAPQDIVFFEKHFRNSSIHLDRRVHMLFVLEFSGRSKPLTCNI